MRARSEEDTEVFADLDDPYRDTTPRQEVRGFSQNWGKPSRGSQSSGKSSPRGSHRVPSPHPVVRGRIVVAAVAAGAFVAAGQSMAAGEGEPDHEEFTPLAAGDAAASFGSVAAEDSKDGVGGQSPEVLSVAKTSDANAEVQKLFKSERIAAERAEAEKARKAAEAEANRPKFVKPADGNFTSGFGGRWGTTHYGIDLANSIGTPIVSAADGTVIEAGPASGFGQWIRVQHTDGTITVYGHIDTIDVNEGETVKAGDQIATMGSEGFSTGPHLHFEVWDASGTKTNPLPWLQEHGISVS